MKQIDLSVIVACYNIQDYVGDCLKSLAEVQFPSNNMEVLAVDDGSTDHTSQILDEFDRKYPQIHALHKPNGGLSQARNYGMDRAHGKYIAFVDGDDLVPPDAYTNLVYAAEAHHSQVVVGFVDRFNNLKHKGSPLHKLSVKNDTFNTDLQHSHNLLYDTTAWNKLYLKSFLDQHHFRFIPRILYEDIPFVLNVYLHASRISYIKDVVYDWRKRSQSITQSRGALSNFESRLHSLELCRKEFRQAGYHRSDSLIVDFRRKVLRIDLQIFLTNVGDTNSTYLYRVQELVYRFMRNWQLLNSPLIKQLPIKTQLLYYAIKTGNFDLLRRFTYQTNSKMGALKHTHFRHHYYHTIDGVSRKVLCHLDPTDNVLSITQKLNRLHADHTQQVVHGTGMFRIKHLQLFKKLFSNQNRREQISAQLVNLSNHKRLPIHFFRRKTRAYKRIFHPKTTWTNTRYGFDFNYHKATRKLGAGTWQILVTDVIDHRFWVQEYLGSPSGRKLMRPMTANRLVITNDFNTNWQLVFNVRSQKLIGHPNVDWLQNPRIADDQLVFDANLLNAGEVTPRILLDANHQVTGQISRNDHGFQVRFQLANWPADFFQDHYPLQLVHTRTGKLIPYLFPTQPAVQTKAADAKRQVLIAGNDRNAIQIGFQYRQLVVQHYNLIHGRVLRVTAQLSMPYHYQNWRFNHLKIVMVNNSLKHRYLLTVQKHQIKVADHHLIFTIPLLSKNAKQLLTLSGNYHFIVYLPVSNDQVIKTGIVMPVKLSMAAAAKVAIKTDDRVLYRVSNDKDGGFRFHVKQPWSGFERSRSHRALAYSLFYPLMRMLPLQNTMFFDSYWSTQFSSNERAIYKYVREHYPKIKTVWSFRNRQTPITGNGIRVRVNSLKYWYYLATSKYIFQNANLPNHYFKRSGQIEVETLHGTFLKHMGFDEPYFKTGSRKRQQNFTRRNRRWDYMVVPSDYMRRIASHAFDYHQQIIPSGFPRNDELSFHNNQNYINSIKRKLNIPLNKRVVLYAPTFRNRQGFNFPLNLRKLKQKLAPEYVILIRLHYFVAHSKNFYGYPGFVYDVSDYPDINDLYLISDVLVTDYSSVMFDYAYLKRPMIFYAYDKRLYLNDRNRGTYLDYDTQMPGPIVATEDDLIKTLNNLRSVQTRYWDRLLGFNQRFAQYGQKGDATKQVVETVLHTPKRQLDQKPDRHVVFNKFWHWFRIKDFQATLLNYLNRILPTRNIIIFESYFGTQYSDNPKAIYQYIKQHDPKYKLYWDIQAQAVPYFKAHHIPYVVQTSYRGICKRAQAKYWITNSITQEPNQWTSPQRALILQTWHGTPLKKIGADVNLIVAPGSNANEFHKQIYENDLRWRYLLAPNPYSARIMQRAFRKKPCQMMLTGYPRNDALVNYSKERISRIKQRLGIDSQRKIILYSPTWRDDQFIKTGKYVARLHLDLAQFRHHYGKRVLVLIRSHYLIANHLDLSDYRDIAMNVSDYPDINDLYLISDVLITDYSSAMFDYAILKRPMIFFDYDLRTYAERARGLYFDPRKVLPGPVVQTTRQVIQKLDPILSGHWQISDRYRQFLNKFAAWSDGHASARVAQQLLSGHNVKERFLTRQQLKLSHQVEIRDGALMWRSDQDFCNPSATAFRGNYDYDGRPFKVIKGMQLHSATFNQPLGMRFVLVKSPSKLITWVSYDDVVDVSN